MEDSWGKAAAAVAAAASAYYLYAEYQRRSSALSGDDTLREEVRILLVKIILVHLGFVTPAVITLQASRQQHSHATNSFISGVVSRSSIYCPPPPGRHRSLHRYDRSMRCMLKRQIRRALRVLSQPTTIALQHSRFHWRTVVAVVTLSPVLPQLICKGRWWSI